MVLGGAAQHRRSADINVLDAILVAAIRFGDGAGEGIEIHDQQIDRRYLMFGHHRIIGAAAAQQAAVDLRMQGS